jgi:predicted nucleic acid-binding protein
MASDARRPTDAKRGRGDSPLPARPLTLVVDPSVAVPACLAANGFASIPDSELVAPPLLWSEVRSALHELVWRGEVDAETGAAANEVLDGCPVRRIDDDRLGAAAWRIADELGWAKSYDAEYVALAQLLGCRMVTRDGRLRRGAGRLGIVFFRSELAT